MAKDDTIDPTKNVLDLVDVEKEHARELRVADERLANLRAEYIAKMAAAEARRVDEQAALRETYAEKLRLAEANRIDAIRAVDVAAVAIASQRASDQATVLQTQVATSAEALRNLVASTATAAAVSLQQQIGPITTRLTALEQAQYEGKGRSTVADPAFAQLLDEVKRLGEARSVSTGVGQGISTSWAVFIAVGMLLVAVIGTGVALKSGQNSNIQPTVQYVPAPTAMPTTPAPAPVTVPR